MTNPYLAPQNPYLEEDPKPGLFQRAKGAYMDEMHGDVADLKQMGSSALSTTGQLTNTLKRGANWLGAESIGSALGGATDWLNAHAQSLAPTPLAESASLNDKISRSVAQFAGASVPMIPLTMATSGVLNPLAEGTIGGAFGTSQLGLAAKAGLSQLPGGVAGVAAFGPEQLKTPSGIIAATLPSFIGALGAFIPQAKALAAEAADLNSPITHEDVVTAINSFGKKLQPVGRIVTDTDLQVPQMLQAAGEPVNTFSWFERQAGKNLAAQKVAWAKVEKAMRADKKAGLESTFSAFDDALQDFTSLHEDYQNLIEPFRWTEGNPTLREPSVIATALTDGDHFVPPVATSTADQTIAGAVSRANIQYGKRAPIEGVDNQPSFFQKWFDRSAVAEKISPLGKKLLDNQGSVGTDAELAITTKMGLPVGDPALGVTREIAARPLQAVVNDADAIDGRQYRALLKANLTVSNPDVPTGMPLDDAIVLTQKADPRLQELTQEYKKVTDWMVDFGQAHGLWSADRADELKRAFYAPNRAYFNQNKGYNQAAKRLGTDKPSADPVAQTANNIRDLIERGKKNTAFTQLVDGWKANAEELADWFSPVEANNSAVKALRDEYVADGMSHATATDLAQANLMGTLDRSNNTLTILRKGKLEAYKVNPEVADMVQAFNPLELSEGQKFLRMFSRPIRESVALANDLSGYGPAADAVRGKAAASVAGIDFNVFTDPVKAAWSIATKDGTYREAVRAGLNTGSRGRLEDLVTKTAPFWEQTGPEKVATIANTPGAALAALNDLIRPLNTATRLALYKGQIANGMIPTEAANFANEALGNWNKVGSAARGLSAIVEFGNYGLQTGMRDGSLIRAALKNPIKAGAPLAAAGFTYITLPTLGFYFASQGDKDIEALRKADNYDNWYFRTPGSTGPEGIHKIHKLGWGMAPIFGSSIEMALDKMRDNDPAALDRLAQTFWNTYGTNAVPITLQTALGLATNNRDPISLNTAQGNGIPIVPRKEQGLDPSVQAGENVSNLAHGISQAVPVSPFKVDYVLEKLLGTVGADVVQLAGGKMGGGRDVPVFSRYNVSPKAQTEGSTAFYRDLDRASEAYKTAQRMGMDGDPRLDETIQAKQTALGAYQQLAKTAQNIGQANAYINMIARDNSLSKEDKEKEIAAVRANINEFFRTYAEISKGDLRGIRH